MVAYYRHGETTMIDHIGGSGGDSAGDVNAWGTGSAIVHSDIEEGRLGAISVPNGNCVYEIDKTTAADVFAVGDSVEITHATNSAELATAGDADLGICVKASGNGDLTVWVLVTALDAA